MRIHVHVCTLGFSLVDVHVWNAQGGGEKGGFCFWNVGVGVGEYFEGDSTYNVTCMINTMS